MLTRPEARLAPPPALNFDAAALFLDLDGTLAPIEARPEAVRPDPGRSALLDRLASRLGGRLAVVSGRTIGSIDEILEGRVACAAGVHGLERRGPSGSIVRLAPHGGLNRARMVFADLAASAEGLLLEDKGLSLALHYRLAPSMAGRVIGAARELAASTGLALQLGDQVVELKTPGADKGTAVGAFMQEPPFAGRYPVFVGDDLTDEHAFAAAGDLGGFGILVGPPRETLARWGLPDVDAVLAWLESSLEQAKSHD